MGEAKVDTYIAKARPFARPILKHIRQLVHRALPDAEEALKWGVPYFVVNGKNAVGMAAFTNHASVIVCSEERAGGGMGNYGKLTRLEQLPSDDDLIAHFRQSARAVQSLDRSKGKPNSKPNIPIPDDFAAALANVAGAQEVFDGFTDAQRRDYLDWVVSAKREATRARRIANAAEWIGEGKKRNWQYANC